MSIRGKLDLTEMDGEYQHVSESSLASPPSFSDDDFLDSITQKMPERDRNTIEILDKVKSIYIECGRDKVLAENLGNFLKDILSRRNDQRDDGRAFFITGESGAGKTRAVEHMLSQNVSLQPQTKSFGTIRPVISVNLSGPCTLKILGRRILREAGYPLRQNIEQGELWDMLPEQLHHRKVLIVHIDETQHMLRQTKTDRDRENLAKAFKGVMNHKAWPVSFIMSGMPETTELSRLDEQIERRGRYCFLPDLDLPTERKLVEKIIRKMAGAANLGCENIISSDLPERIAHTARYRYGRIAQVMLSAITIALNDGHTDLMRNHFAYAYLEFSHARGHDEMNPFLVDDWERLEPGLFLMNGRDG